MMHYYAIRVKETVEGGNRKYNHRDLWSQVYAMFLVWQKVIHKSTVTIKDISIMGMKRDCS